MTTASSIISAAYREGQITAIVSSPTTLEQTEALDRLNAILASLFGNEIGVELVPYNIGPPYDETAYTSTYSPVDARLILNLGGAETIKLHPEPYDGARMGIADAGLNLATYNLTLDGNGRTIEGAKTITLSTNGMARQWFYRDDLANWVKNVDLALTDNMPLPEEFDDYFITKLATRLFPRSGIATSQETAMTLAEAKAKMRARYRRKRPANDMPHNFIGSRRNGYGLTQADFNAGRPWRW